MKGFNGHSSSTITVKFDVFVGAFFYACFYKNMTLVAIHTLLFEGLCRHKIKGLILSHILKKQKPEET